MEMTASAFDVLILGKLAIVTTTVEGLMGNNIEFEEEIMFLL